MKLLQLCEHKEIVEPRKYCLVCLFFSLAHIFIYFYISDSWEYCVYSLYIETRKILYKDSIYVCVYLYWRTTLKSFFFTKRLKIILVLSMDKKLPMTILKLRSIDFMKRFFFFFFKKKAWRLIEERPTIFLFLRNHNKNFGWKLCLIPLDSVN